MGVKARIKAAALPHGRHVRRLPVGIGRGLRMGVDFQRGETRLYLGLYEVELNRHLRRIARPGLRSFDLGAQYGYDALVLAKLTGASVVAVECDPALAAEVRENIAVNPGLPEIAVEVGFVGSGDEGQVTVDGLSREYFVPDIIKCDIEGGEAEALAGAWAVLTMRGPAALIEVHSADVEWECLSLMRAAGYPPPIVVDRRTWLPEHRPLPHNRWLVFYERPM